MGRLHEHSLELTGVAAGGGDDVPRRDHRAVHDSDRNISRRWLGRAGEDRDLFAEDLGKLNRNPSMPLPGVRACERGAVDD
jgi:hypothetical protein